MRTIGKKNILLVQGLTKQEVKKGTNAGMIADKVIAQLPSELWDTWEGSHQQIERIINDTIMAF